MNLQHLIDGMSADWQRERASTQMTLGKLIEALAATPGDKLVDGLERAHSYRGYYEDLAFERANEQLFASDMLAMCRACMGEVFTGYKGGDFVMGSLTPVWIADYGCTGVKIIGINEDGSIVTKEDSYD